MCLLFAGVLSVAALPTNATTYAINIENYGAGNSHVHAGTMPDTWQLGKIVSAVGTYDDVTGTLDATFTVALWDSASRLSTPGGALGGTREIRLYASGFSFGADSVLVNPVSGTFDLLGDDVHKLIREKDSNGKLISERVETSPAGSYDILFKAKKYPNSGSNTLIDTVQGKELTLWGNGKLIQGGTTFWAGADFTLGLTAVPIPAAFLLFGSGLLALFGVRRRALHVSTS